MDERVIDQREHVENGNQPDGVRAEDEHEDVSSSGVHVSTHLSPTLGRDDGVAHELHDGLR